MDKYEYNLKIEQINKMSEKKDFETAGEIADGIDIRKIRDNSLFNTIADAYEETGQFEKAIEVLLIAYERSPLGRQLAYRLTLLAVKADQFSEAVEFYNDFIKAAPKDIGQYILRYQLAKLEGVPVEEQIHILEEYVSIEMDEKWQYELAKLYHEAGLGEKCVEQCDEIILWFNNGSYVEEAMELKMLYEPLSRIQQDKYDNLTKSQEEIISDEKEEDEPLLESKTSEEEKIETKLEPESAESAETEEAEAEPLEKMEEETEPESTSEFTAEKKVEFNEEEVFFREEEETPLEEEELRNTVQEVLKEESKVQEYIQPSYQNILVEEDAGGQIALYIEEPKKIEEQIEGQLTIGDLLDAYEEKQRLKRMREDELRQEQQAASEAGKPHRIYAPNAKKSRQPSNEEPCELCEEYKIIFTRYLSVGGVEEQLVKCMDSLIGCYDRDGTSSKNNLIIMGDAKTGRTSLIVELIKIVNRKRGRRGRKIAKVKGGALNNKGLKQTFQSLMGADLIIEQAANMNPDTVDALAAAMSSYTQDMIVVLEDNNSAIERLLNANSILKNMFENVIDIQGMGVKDWVEIAKEYAEEKEYTIDEMGILALHVKVGTLFSQNPQLNEEDMCTIIDDAIHKNKSVKIGKIFSAFSGKKKKSEPNVLKEADFM